MERRGNFSEELYWELFKPLFIREDNAVIGYFDHTDNYRDTCMYISAEILYDSRKVILGLIPKQDKPIEYYTKYDITSGDLMVQLTYNPKDWIHFLQYAGSLEEMRARVEALNEYKIKDQLTRRAIIANRLSSLPLLPREEILKYGLKIDGGTRKRHHKKRTLKRRAKRTIKRVK
jgi:hypothetical protein